MTATSKETEGEEEKISVNKEEEEEEISSKVEESAAFRAACARRAIFRISGQTLSISSKSSEVRNTKMPAFQKKRPEARNSSAFARAGFSMKRTTRQGRTTSSPLPILEISSFLLFSSAEISSSSSTSMYPNPVSGRVGGMPSVTNASCVRAASAAARRPARNAVSSRTAWSEGRTARTASGASSDATSAERAIAGAVLRRTGSRTKRDRCHFGQLGGEQLRVRGAPRDVDVSGAGEGGRAPERLPEERLAARQREKGLRPLVRRARPQARAAAPGENERAEAAGARHPGDCTGPEAAGD